MSCLDFGNFYSGGLLPIECWDNIYKSLHNSYINDLCKEIYLKKQTKKYMTYIKLTQKSNVSKFYDWEYYALMDEFNMWVDELEEKDEELYNDLFDNEIVIKRKHNLLHQLKYGEDLYEDSDEDTDEDSDEE